MLHSVKKEKENRKSAVWNSRKMEVQSGNVKTTIYNNKEHAHARGIPWRRQAHFLVAKFATNYPSRYMHYKCLIYNNLHHISLLCNLECTSVASEVHSKLNGSALQVQRKCTPNFEFVHRWLSTTCKISKFDPQMLNLTLYVKGF